MIDMSEDLIKNSYNIQDIIKILPHRYPFILIDRIDEVKQGEYVNAIKNVTINEPSVSYTHLTLPTILRV